MMTNERILVVLNQYYAEKKRAAETAAERNFEKAMEDAEFRKLEAERRQLCVEAGRLTAEGKSAAAKMTKLRSLEKRMQTWLDQNGLDTRPHYRCKDCGDSGIRKDGAYCNCYKNLYYRLLKDSLGMNSLPVFQFSDHRLGENTPQTKFLSQVYQKMQEYCRQFPDTKTKTWIISGGMGTGKTSLISAAANALYARNFSVQYLTAFELNNLFLKYHTADMKQRNSVMETLLNCDLLIVDDLGTEPLLKNVTLEYLFNVINSRTLNQKHTMVSTNLTGDELIDRYGPRIYSRLTQKNMSACIELKGKDLRKGAL